MDKHRLTLIVIGALGLVIIAGGWFVGVQPQLDRIEAANSQTASIRQINDVQQKKNEALAADNDRLEEYKTDLAAKQQEIPASRAQQELINQIDAAATAAGVTVKNLRFDVAAAYIAPAGVDVAGPSSGTLVDVPLTLSADGPRPQLEDFVAKLQSSPRIVTISQSDFTGGEETSLTLTGTTWVLLPAS
ncbi:type 4a pilus biogenesis protein PilO [Microbacterium aurum]